MAIDDILTQLGLSLDGVNKITQVADILINQMQPISSKNTFCNHPQEIRGGRGGGGQFSHTFPLRITDTYKHMGTGFR